MPKQTFFNLPEEKRRVIEETALEEFSQYGYDNSNMNRIVAGSKIAKGSFYQYFKDKKDLYFHLMDTLSKRKMALLQTVLDKYKENSFSYNLEELFRLGLKFADSDPKLYRVGEDFATKKPEFVREFIEKYSPMSQDVYGMLLENARNRGELYEDVDLQLARMFVNNLMNQTIVGLLSNHDQEKRKYIIKQLLTFIERAILKGNPL